MIEKQTTIINKLGLHARAAAKLVATASSFASQIEIAKDDHWVDAKSIMSVMLLAASKGTLISIRANGDDEAQAMQAVLDLIADYFEEGE